MQPEIFSVKQFCEVYGVSRAKLYQLFKSDQGPRVIKLGRRTLISREAAEAWRRALEQNPRSAVRTEISFGRSAADSRTQKTGKK